MSELNWNCLFACEGEQVMMLMHVRLMVGKVRRYS